MMKPQNISIASLNKRASSRSDNQGSVVSKAITARFNNSEPQKNSQASTVRSPISAKREQKQASKLKEGVAGLPVTGEKKETNRGRKLKGYQEQLEVYKKNYKEWQAEIDKLQAQPKTKERDE